MLLCEVAPAGVLMLPVLLCKIPPVGEEVVAPALEPELELELDVGALVPLAVTTTEGTTYVVARLAIGFATTVCVVGSLQVTFPAAVEPQHSHFFVWVSNVISRFFRFPQAILQWGSAREGSVHAPR